MKLSVREACTLFNFLQANADGSGTKMRKKIKHGDVRVDGQTVMRPDVLVLPGQTVEISRPTLQAPFPVLYEDAGLLAAEKPAGLLSIGTDRETSNTFYRAVNHYVQLRSQGKDRIFIVHRLDREVSGVMLFAKSQVLQEALRETGARQRSAMLRWWKGILPNRKGTSRTG